MNRKTLRVYDPDTRKVTTVPFDELVPGMTMVTVEGVEGTVWMVEEEVADSEFRHPPFFGERLEAVRSIMETLTDVLPKTIKEWEDGFRRDSDPDSEIAIWLHISSCYETIRVGTNFTLEEKKDCVNLMLHCSGIQSEESDRVLQMVDLNELPKVMAREIIDLFYSSI